MDIQRLVRHLLTTRRNIKRTFPPEALSAIENAIADSERTHAGEIRFVVEAALDGSPLFSDQSSRARAIDIFSQYRIWDTEQNNGVLIYLLLADRSVEIVADRGIHGKAGAHEWERICHQMETAFRQGDYEAGVLSGIEAVTLHLKQHYPADGEVKNELPNQVLVL
ncbi:TPM domain-containing protein [Duganella violaceipulchra]|uniref:Membrane protein n=1 Tax=Duganella violaceipulchra TaxID=2849652 RepID=A0AA41HBL3_9BURK|nr:TPM domain-containing protein [Duganella violaceicalia]MBV6324390.1 TPM domain-containing protein [Duganella violaceicalia]MCP2011993.1 putative membrane protein [Duganella violaceicalia]